MTQQYTSTTAQRFRPTQIALAPDGNLYVLAWYGMNDENELTGRLYKISYVGKEGTSLLAIDETSATAGLASRHHLTRQRTREELLAEGPAAAERLARQLPEPDALGAAESLWTLRQSTLSNAASIMEKGLQHSDWRVRRLAIQLLRERGVHSAALEELVDDPDPAVQLEAAIGLPGQADRVRAVARSLRAGAATSQRLRYRAALEVARQGKHSDFKNLLTDDDTNVRLAGLIALDEAFHEGESVEDARSALVELISQSENSLLVELLAMAERWPHPAFEQPVISALKRDLSVQETIRGVAVLRRLKLSPTRDTWGDALDSFWHRVANCSTPLRTRDDKLGTLAILALDQLQPDQFVLLGRFLRDEDSEVRAETHQVLATIGVANQVCIELCRQLVGDSGAPLEYRLETIVSLAQIEQQLAVQTWQELLASPSREVALVTLRCLRSHIDQTAVTELLGKFESRLTTRGTEFQAALKTREQFLAVSTGSQAILAQLYAQENDPVAARRKEGLRARLLERQQQGDPLLGRFVFRSQVCSRCHRSGGQAEFSGPPLDGVAATNTVEYLIDSILYPSKTIKTGFMLELIVTQDGRTLVGGVARDGDELVITSPTGSADRVALKRVEERRQINRSLMPESLDLTMSEPELTDLVAYLATLRESRGQ